MVWSSMGEYLTQAPEGLLHRLQLADLYSIFLFLATADAQIKADNAILVPGADGGEVAIKIVLPLNDLL